MDQGIKKTSKSVWPFPVHNKVVLMAESITGAKLVAWFEKKNDFNNSFLAKMNILCNEVGFAFEILHMDGARENETFVKKANSAEWKFRIEPEITPRDTLHMNSVE